MGLKPKLLKLSFIIILYNFRFLRAGIIFAPPTPISQQPSHAPCHNHLPVKIDIEVKLVIAYIKMTKHATGSLNLDTQFGKICPKL